MRQGCIVLLTLLASPAAVADCPSPWVGIGGTVLGTAVSNDDRRELERLLGTQLDEVACARMHRTQPHGFADQRGFFVLTVDEALFVSDRKVKEVLFRTNFPGVRDVYRSGFVSPRVDNTIPPHVPAILFLHVATDAGPFRFELACDVIARRVVGEFERRTVGKTRVPAPRGQAQYSCPL